MVRIESQPRQACCCVDLLLAQGFHLVCGQIKDLHGECSQSASAPSYGDASVHPLTHCATYHGARLPLHAMLLAM